MRISEIKLHSIAIADPPLRSSYGLHAPWALRTIVELKTDDGVSGVSETYGGEAPRAALEAARARALGMDPFRMAGLWERMNAGLTAGVTDETVPGGHSQTWLVPGENPLDQNARTFAALEIGCLDIIGKAVGQPVCDLLGGRVRDAVPFSAYLFYKHTGGGGENYPDEYGEVLSPEALVHECGQMISQYGFKEIKLKGGVLDPDIEIESIRALRKQFGADVPLRIDPNCAWSIDTSVRVANG